MMKIGTFFSRLGFAFACGVFLPISGHCQPGSLPPPREGKTTQFDPGNGWYNPAYQYFRLNVSEDGVFRVSLSDLQGAGINTSGLNSTSLKVYYRGEEIPIWVKTSGSTLQYFEFWGRKNDGGVDSLLYKDPYTRVSDPNQQPNIHHSIFTDTSSYFLTWDGSNGARNPLFFESDYSSYSPENSFRTRALSENNTNFFIGGGGAENPWHVLNPDYITGEGYAGTDLSSGEVNDCYFSTPNHVPGGGGTQVRMRVIGSSTHNHLSEFYYDGNLVHSYASSNINISTQSFSISGNLGATTRVDLLVAGAGGSNPDKQNFCWGDLIYDRNFDLSGANSIQIVDYQHSTKSYLRFTNVGGGSEAWLIDLDSHERIQGTFNAGVAEFIVPGSSRTRRFQFFTDQAVKNPTIQNHTFLNNLSDSSNGADFLIITHRTLASSAESYRLYRDTCTANPMGTVRVVYTDEIYDEFGYGSHTPLAIKRFLYTVQNQWGEKPRFVLLLGKGGYRPREGGSLVPTWGYPADDHEFVSNYDVDNFYPWTSIGRVNAENNQDGEAFLAKIREYEHQSYDLWMKKVILLGGGQSIGEQDAIATYLKDYFLTQMELAPASAQVSYWRRKGNGIDTNSDLTTEAAVNQGAAIISFFGHSSAKILDVDLRRPNEYSNFGKYPFMVAFGCYSGDFTVFGKSLGEEFIMEPGRGAIGYLANSTAGYLSELGNYGKVFYAHLNGGEYGMPIGTVMDSTFWDYISVGGQVSNQINTLNHARQINLQGDPSLILALPTKPDLRVGVPDLYFSESVPSSEAPEWEMRIVAHNDGRFPQDSFAVRIIQHGPLGQTIQLPDTLVSPFLIQDTLVIKIKNLLGRNAAGLNEFQVFLDATDHLNEYYENNNQATLRQFISGNAPEIVYPPDFGIIPEAQPTLSASNLILTTQNPVAFEFQIDSVSTFDSPFLQSSGRQTGSSTLGSWTIPFSCEPEKVYFWRVRLADVYPVSWASGSFQHRPNIQGWGQTVPMQFAKDIADTISMDPLLRQWVFDRLTFSMHIFIEEGSLKPEFFFGPFKSNTNTAPSGTLYNLINHRTLVPSITNTSFGDWNYANSASTISTTIAQLPQGDYFMLVSNIDANLAAWTDNDIHQLEQIGCDYQQFRNLPPEKQFIILGRKGDPPGSAMVVTEPNSPTPTGGMRWRLASSLSTSHPQGTIHSTLIGPTSRWDSLWVQWVSQDPIPSDTLSVSVYGVTNDSREVLLRMGLGNGWHDLSTISADAYPRLRLVAHARDESYRTPPQLTEWVVACAPVPEAAVDPAALFSFSHDTIREGEIVAMRIAARNISTSDMDSLLVRFSVESNNRNKLVLGEQRFKPLLADSTIPLAFSFVSSMKGLKGDVKFVVEINPDYDQPERYSFNNVYSHPFYVLNDKVKPMLDVVVDGKYIMDGEIISPNPEIVIQLDDENTLLPVILSDSTCELYFGKGRSLSLLPSIAIEHNPMVDAFSGKLPQNKAKIIFRPGPLDDGEYTLRFQSSDFSGNAIQDYVLHMTVINQKSISQVLNYPNPFSSSTRFVYTLTGDEKPYRFEIQIYTISGKLVKVIDLLEEGDVHFGYNITEYAWDGRDEFGDLLATGVYIYKPVIKFRDRFNVTIRDEGISEYFQNGMGKMVIIR